MCTVTWLEVEGGYHLFCNRDELKSRGPALAPRIERSAGGRFLAPLDADGGGTWVAVNDRGLALTLLNDYAADQDLGDPARRVSRGRLVVRLAAAASAAAAVSALAGLDLERYRPFRLVLLAPGSPVLIRHWDGRGEAGEAPSEPPLLTSSSYDPAAVDRRRRQLLGRPAGGHRVETLEAFHRSHRPVRGPLSPCMHREDAGTVSFTRVSVGAGRAAMGYLEGSPCRGSASDMRWLELPLERSPSPPPRKPRAIAGV